MNSRRHLFVFADREALLKDEARLLTLKHPRTGMSAKFIMVDGELQEIQKVQPERPSSWFVDQSVKSDGSLYICSKIDPLFVLLPLLEKHQEKFVPFTQILEEGKTPHYRLLAKLKDIQNILDKVCDSDARYGAEMHLVRFNIVKAKSWFLGKIDKVCKVLTQTQASQNQLSVAGFNLDTKTAGAVHQQAQRCPPEDALKVIGDYLPKKWEQIFAEELKTMQRVAKQTQVVLEEEEPEFHDDPEEQLPPEEDLDEDEHARHRKAILPTPTSSFAPKAYTVKTVNGQDVEDTTNKSEQPKGETSMGVKQLAKVNIRGMAKLSTFFVKKK